MAEQGNVGSGEDFDSIGHIFAIVLFLKNEKIGGLEEIFLRKGVWIHSSRFFGKN
jgi:hypothetical protein